MSSRSPLAAAPLTHPISHRSTGGRSGGRLDRETTSPPRAKRRSPGGGAPGATDRWTARAVLLSLLAGAALLPAEPALAADGNLDGSFHFAGKYVHEVASEQGGVALAFRADGVPLVGYTALLAGTDRDMRLLPVPDGEVPLFCGSYHPDLGGTDTDVLTSLAVIGNRAYLAGSAAGPADDPVRRAAVGALNPSTCTFDPSFGGPDGALIEFDSDAPIAGLALSHAGGVRLALALDAGQSDERLWTIGLHEVNGAIDGGFDQKLVNFATAYGAAGFEPAALLRQPDGRLLVAGTVFYADGDRDVGLVRLDSSGALDNSFSLDGLLSFAYDIVDAGTDEAWAVGVLPDQRIVLAGRVERESGYQAAVAIVTPTGGFDNGFGVVGRYAFDFSSAGRRDVIRSVAVQGDGRIVVAGSSGPDTLFSATDFGVARLLPVGDEPLDPTFVGTGRRLIVFDWGGFEADAARAVALDPQGRIVVTGSVSLEDGIGIGIARMVNSYVFADGFEWGPWLRWHSATGLPID